MDIRCSHSSSFYKNTWKDFRALTLYTLKTVSWEAVGSFYGMKTPYTVLYVELEIGYAPHTLLYSTVFALNFTFP